MKFFRVGLLLIVLGFSQLVSAQGVQLRAGERELSGTIDKTREDSGYISISGWDYGFDDEITRVFYGGKEVGVEILASGIIVRYTLDQNDMLLTIEILGPQEAIANIENS